MTKKKKTKQRTTKPAWTRIESGTKPGQARKTELKQENDFGNDTEQKFNYFNMGNRSHGTRLTKAEQRMEEMEAANTELRDTLLYSLREQKGLQAKLIDLEGRSHRNTYMALRKAQTEAQC